MLSPEKTRTALACAGQAGAQCSGCCGFPFSCLLWGSLPPIPKYFNLQIPLLKIAVKERHCLHTLSILEVKTWRIQHKNFLPYCFKARGQLCGALWIIEPHCRSGNIELFLDTMFLGLEEKKIFLFIWKRETWGENLLQLVWTTILVAPVRDPSEHLGPHCWARQWRQDPIPGILWWHLGVRRSILTQTQRPTPWHHILSAPTPILFLAPLRSPQRVILCQVIRIITPGSYLETPSEA